MTDQHPGYREDWDITSEGGSLCFASAIYSRLVGGEQDEATLQWLAKYLRANAAPQRTTTMTDQHQHRATPEQWAIFLETSTGNLSPCLLELRDRIQLLEATQHAHIEAKASEASEAGARYAVEQMRGRPGSWQPLKVETTYGSDAAIPELSEHRAPDEWVGHHLATARNLVRDIGSRPVTVEGSFDMGGQSYSYKTEAEPTPGPAATPQQPALLERVAKRLARFASEGLPGDDATPISSAVLYDVAEWLRAGAVSDWDLATADLLHNEASR